MKYIRPRRMPDGSLVYPKRGWEPPPSIMGYHRKSNDPKTVDAWVFIPDFDFCEYRIEEEIKREGCGCITYTYVCGCPQETRTSTACKTCILNE